MSPKYNHICPYKMWQRGFDTDMQGRRADRTRRPQRLTEVVHPQAKECLKLPETRRGKKQNLPLEPLEGAQPC